ncbi:MAG: hypothetical protein ABII01_04310 [Candidatus Woesearchaeota archaeon]
MTVLTTICKRAGDIIGKAYDSSRAILRSKRTRFAAAAGLLLLGANCATANKSQEAHHQALSAQRHVLTQHAEVYDVYSIREPSKRVTIDDAVLSIALDNSNPGVAHQMRDLYRERNLDSINFSVRRVPEPVDKNQGYYTFGEIETRRFRFENINQQVAILDLTGSTFKNLCYMNDNFIAQTPVYGQEKRFKDRFAVGYKIIFFAMNFYNEKPVLDGYLSDLLIFKADFHSEGAGAGGFFEWHPFGYVDEKRKVLPSLGIGAGAEYTGGTVSTSLEFPALSQGVLAQEFAYFNFYAEVFARLNLHINKNGDEGYIGYSYQWHSHNPEDMDCHKLVIGYRMFVPLANSERKLSFRDARRN